MQDVIIGIVAVVVGALLCFRGYAALRVVIAVWGAFVGFFLGAALVAGLTGDGFLATATGWIVGVVVGLAFGLVAYLFYAVSVVIGMGAIGFALGTTAMAALDVTWSWVVVLVGIAAGVLLAVLAIVGRLPLLILAVVGAFAGASTILTGVLLLTGALDSPGLATPQTTQTLGLTWWWTVAYLALAVIGLIVQIRSVQVRRGSLRQAWNG